MNSSFIKPFIWGLFSIVFLVLTGCEEPVKKEDPIFDKKINYQKRIKLAIESDLLTKFSFPKEIIDSVYLFYKETNFQPVWTNDTLILAKGEKWKNFLKYPCALGVPDNRLFQIKQDSLAQTSIIQEFYLTAQLAQLEHDLQVGFLDTASNHYRPLLSTSVARLKLSISSFDTVTHWGSWFANKGFNRPEYKSLAKALFYKAFGKTLSSTYFEIPSLEDDSISCINLSKESLIEKGYLNRDSSDANFETALKNFQIDNGIKGDGNIGVYTRSALKESQRYRMHRAVLSLERWRWRSAFPERYIWVNIPEYKLRIFYNDTLFLTHNVVVGKPENQTPQLTSKLRAIITLPYWTQPQKIAEKEFLPAIQSNPHYATKNEYKVFRGDKEVDPLSINWKRYKEKNFPFRIRQEPGDKNALGLVKFEFSNKYGVYLHDTPSKGFFKRDIRAFSHGCVRCDLPDSLARFILSRDDKRQKMTRDSLDTLIARKEQFPILLRKPIPIQLDYITVTTNEKGKMIIFPDIYLRDEKYLKDLKIYQKVN